MGIESSNEVAQGGADVLKDSVDFVYATLKFLKDLLSRDETDNDAQRLFEHLDRKGDPSALPGILIKDFSAKDFENQLKRMGVPCKITRVIDGPDKGLDICIIRDKDIALAMTARQICFSMAKPAVLDNGSIVKPAVELSSYALNTLAKEKNTTLQQTRYMNEVKAKYLMEECRQKGIVFTADKAGGKTSLVFMDKDKKNMTEALQKTEVTFSGLIGKYDYEAKKQDLSAVKESMSYVDTKGSEKEFYVVSGNNVSNVIKVDENSVTHNNVRKRMSDRTDLHDYYKQEVYSMKNPVVLSKEEYENAAGDKKALKKLTDKKRTPLRIRKEDVDVCRRQDMIRSGLIQKMYFQQNMGFWDLREEAKQIQEVKDGTLSLEEYLFDGTEYTPDEDVINLSDEEKQVSINEIGEIMESLSHIEQELTEKVYEPDELKKDMKDLIRQGHLVEQIESHEERSSEDEIE